MAALRSRSERLIRTLISLAAIGPAPAAAEPPHSTGDPALLERAAPAREPTAADVAGAPVPGDESGRIDAGDGGDSPLRLVGRGILFVPRIAVQVAATPARTAVHANDRYHLVERFHTIFFNDDDTLGLYPTLRFDSGFGVTGGARFVARDLFGAREHLAVFGGIGGRYRERATTSFRTGHRFGDLAFELGADYERRSRDPFYGIGNGDEMAAPGAPIDPLVDPASVEARYRQRLVRARAVADARIARDLHVRGAGALTDLELARSDDGPPIDELYVPASLTGFSGVRHVYGELGLRWSGRRRATTWEPVAVPSTGWFADVYAGRVVRLDDGPDFWRTGAEVQRLLRIGDGPRVIVTRAHVEAVTGSRAEVPFAELPMLGGTNLLRGYPIERFRDRIAAIGSLDYRWDLSRLVQASVFVDAGRVYESTSELGLEAMRVGYGVEVQAHDERTFFIRTIVASSIDGGLFLSLSLSPPYGVDDRVERR